MYWNKYMPFDYKKGIIFIIWKVDKIIGNYSFFFPRVSLNMTKHTEQNYQTRHNTYK